MNIGMEDHLMLAILRYLEAHVLLREVLTLENLRLRVMKAYFLAIPPRVRPTNVLTTKHEELLRVLMFEWMNFLKS